MTVGIQILIVTKVTLNLEGIFWSTYPRFQPSSNHECAIYHLGLVAIMSVLDNDSKPGSSSQNPISADQRFRSSDFRLHTVHNVLSVIIHRPLHGMQTCLDYFLHTVQNFMNAEIPQLSTVHSIGMKFSVLCICCSFNLTVDVLQNCTACWIQK